MGLPPRLCKLSSYCAALRFLPSYRALVFATKISNLVTATVSTPPSFLLHTGLGRHLAYDD
jgi:hypothetical protein